MTGPLKNQSSACCSGAATVVVSWNTAHIAARKSSGPHTDDSATRSKRSDQRTRRSSVRWTATDTASSIQVNRSSARSNSPVTGGRGNAVGAGVGEGTVQGVQQSGAALMMPGVDEDDGHAEEVGEGIDVDTARPAARDVAHRERDDHPLVGLAQLADEVQRPREPPGVADHHHELRALARLDVDEQGARQRLVG